MRTRADVPAQLREAHTDLIVALCRLSRLEGHVPDEGLANCRRWIGLANEEIAELARWPVQ